ncbi:hypothetical protein ACC689_13520 [Rhizobium ruizarguesonis]
MSNYDLIIQNGTVATAADVFQADIGIKDGKIVQIGQSLSGAARTIDASGKYVLPRRHRQPCRTDHPSCGTA